MDNKRAVMWSLTAAFLAVLAFWLYVQKAVDQQIGTLKKREFILKAKKTIPVGTRIDESMLRRADFPTTYVSVKTAKNVSEVLGQVALVTIFEGQPILTNNLIPFDEGALNRRVPAGQRAVTIGIRDDQDVVGVGGLLRPGQFVDVLVTLFINTSELEKGKRAPTVIAGIQEPNLKAEVRTVFQNVKILAVGKDLKLETASVSRGAFSQSEQPTTKNITVALTPEDAQKLVLVQAIGRITLTLRGFNDPSIVQLSYIDPFKAFGIKLPLAAGPAPAYREIRGGQIFATPY